MRKNVNLVSYDIRYNFIATEGIEKIIEVLEEAKHVYQIEIPERISKTVLDQLKEILAANKPGKKKGKGKGKKKKK